MIFKVLIPVGDIPLDATVTKRTGEKPYKVRDKLVVYYSDKRQREMLTAAGDVRFLVNENGDANAIANTTEVLWYADFFELAELVDEDY